VGEETPRPQIDLLYVLWEAHDGENDIASGSHLGRRGGPFGPTIQKGLGFFACPVMHDQWMATFQKVRGHRTAHDAKANETDQFWHGILLRGETD